MAGSNACSSRMRVRDCPVKVAAVDGGEDRPEQAGPTRPATASGRSGYVWDHTGDRALAASPAKLGVVEDWPWLWLC